MKQVAHLQEILKLKIPEGLVVPQHTESEHRYQYTPTGEIFPSVTGITGITSGSHLKQWAVNEAIRYLDARWDNITPENRSEMFRAAQMAHLDTLKDAGDIGTLTHGVIENYLKQWIALDNQPPDIRKFVLHDDIRLIAAVRSAELFFNDFHIIPVASELKLAHPKYKYGGTMDALMLVGTVLKEGNGSRTGFEKCTHMWSESRGGKHVECFHCGRKLSMSLTLVDFKSSNSIEHDDYAEQLSAYWEALRTLTGIKTKNLFIVRLDKGKARYEVVRVTDRKKAFKAFLHTKQKYDWINDGVSKLYPVVERQTITL